MDDQQRRAIEHDCTQLYARYSHALDDSDGAAVAALYAPDGVWIRPGQEFRGREVIAAAVNKRPAGVVTRHLFMNVGISVVDADHAEGKAYYMVFRHETPAASPLPRPVPDKVERVGDYLISFVRTGEGWRLAKVAPRRVFDS